LQTYRVIFMLIQVAILVIYAIAIIITELLIERRLDLLTKRHNEKIWWWYASVWLLSLHKKLKLILRILSAILFICWAAISLLLL